MQVSDQTPLSIARHAIQFIWQASLSSDNHQIIGLLGSQIKGEIDNATHIQDWQLSPSTDIQDVMQLTHTEKSLEKIKEIAQAWHNNHTFLSGIYQCTLPTIATMQNTEKLLKPHFKQHNNIPFIHLNISFDTKGVLESKAWIIKNNQAIQIPMLLTEDGQTAAKS